MKEENKINEKVTHINEKVTHNNFNDHNGHNSHEHGKHYDNKKHENIHINNKEKEEINKLKSEIENLTKEKNELDNKNKDLEKENKLLTNKVTEGRAELVNYRKRKDDEVAGMLKYANKDLILDLIPVVDNFERAIKLDDNNLTDELSKFLSGFKMMYSELVSILEKYGVTTIDRKGEEFDPNLEQALISDSDKNFKNDEVLEVLLKGYKLKDRVIRPATVKINKIDEKEEKGKDNKNKNERNDK